MTIPRLVPWVWGRKKTTKSKGGLWVTGRAPVFYFLLTMSVMSETSESWALLAGKGEAAVLVFSAATPLERGHMEAERQTGYDRYPQMSLSHGGFENFHSMEYCRIRGGV